MVTFSTLTSKIPAMRRRAFFALAIAPLAACSNSGDEYIGKWADIKRPGLTLTIERQGDNFFVMQHGQKYLATLKDGALHISNGFEYTIGYIKATDTISVAGGEYKRVK